MSEQFGLAFFSVFSQVRAKVRNYMEISMEKHYSVCFFSILSQLEAKVRNLVEMKAGNHQYTHLER